MKTQDTFQSIIKGVSQQAPNERLEGQMADQVNLISDPVMGLVRRNGMVLVTQQSVNADPLHDPDDAIADSYSFRVFSFAVGRNEYDLHYRSRPRVGAENSYHLPFVQAFAKQGAVGFLPTITDPLDTAMSTYKDGGFSSMVVLGRLLLLSGNTQQPVVTTVDRWGDFANQDKAVVYVRTGAYKRTYTVTAKNRSTGTTATASYTTPSSAYPGNLVVDDLDPSDPDYQAHLNNRIYAFEDAQNQWTVTAAAAIVPSAIAEQLRLQLVAGGMTGWTRADNYLYNADIEYAVTADDTGDLQVLVTHNDTDSEQHLSPRHYDGKIVKVTPIKGSDNYYFLEASTEGGEAFGEVQWRETAGTQITVSDMFAFATIENEKLFIASSPAKLAALVLATESVTIGVPQYAQSQAGDTSTGTGFGLPAFATRPIDLLAVFQDRLIVGTGNILRVSATGDYLNFFRASALTVPKTDATEMFASGTQGDVIHKAALYDRNLVFYGDNYHYILAGRGAFDPENPAFSVLAQIKGTGRSQPAQAGDKVIVLKEDSEQAACQVMQMSAGVWQDAPQTDNISKPLRTYINGTPAEMVCLTDPSFLFVRTEFINRSQGAYPLARPFGLYTYSFMDDNANRVHESWSAWEWAAALGTAVGISQSRGGNSIYLYTMAINQGAAGPVRSLLVQEATPRTQPSGMPYLDGLQPASSVAGVLTPDADYRVQGAVRTVSDASHSAVTPVADDFNRWNLRPTAPYSAGDMPPQEVDSLRWSGVHGWGADWLAQHPGQTLDGVWTGMHYVGYVDLTSPVMRNHEDRARLYGHLTLTKLKIATKGTGGIAGDYAWKGGVKRSLYDEGGYTQLKQDYSMFVGRESSEVQLRISSVEWHPLNITSIAWQGDWKNNQSYTRRR